MDIQNKYGSLLNQDTKLHRVYFNEMVKLLGINVIYRAVKPGQKYTTYAELDTTHCKPTIEGCIFNEHPDQQTLKKIGWVSELQQNSSIIHVRYDLPNLSQGALFTVPSGIDNAVGRLFRVVKITNIMVYPASIACEIVPEYENTYDDSLDDFRDTSFNLLNEEDYKL